MRVNEVEKQKKLLLTECAREQSEMAKNDTKLDVLERLLAVWARMVENDTKLVDFERLLAPGLRMIKNDAKLVDFECLLAAWARNGRSLLVTECARQNGRK